MNSIKFSSSSLSLWLRILGPTAIFVAVGASPAAEAGRPDAPPFNVSPASNEGEEALARMRLAKGLKATLFAAEPMVANLVAICPDEKGNFYVVETSRFKHGVFDIREHRDWYDEDLGSTTVEDRVALMHRKLGPNFKRILTSDDDRIVLLQDPSGNGVKADKSIVFADGFNDPADGVAASVLERKGNVYYANIPNLWLLKDTTGDGKADVRKSLSYGYGVRYNFLGHDLHGLRFGPDGKLYFSIGDRGANIEKSVDGRTVVNNDSGSVFRCNADGSGLEIFATGLRNPQQLIFDEYGNLFTGDNNPDYGDPARWVYVVEGGDSGWRVGYQFAENPRGGGPWMAESLWQTTDKLDAESEVPAVAHIGSGPSGVAYYPGTGLNDHYDKHFFMCDFRGASVNSGVHTFTLKPRGAGFEVTNHEEFVWNCLATDICFGPAGGAYVTDWVQGWDTTGKGRVYRIFDPQGIEDPIAIQVKTLLAEGFEKRPVEELIKLLSHRDQRIRQGAQFELADRGAASLSALTAEAQKEGEIFPRIHAMWAIAQIAEKDPKTLDAILPLLADKDDEVRAQAVKLAGNGHLAAAYPQIIKLLSDSSARVRFFAALGAGKLGNKDAAAPVLTMLRENDDKDAWLRHAGVLALVWLDNEDALTEAAKDQSPSVRMASLLAFRRLGSPKVAEFVNDSDPKIVLEAARTINDTFNEPARPALAGLIAKDNLPDYVMIRVLNSNYRLATPQTAAALAQFAARQTAPEKWRVIALKLLGEWEHPSGRDYVMNMWKPLPDRDVKVAQEAVSPVLASIINAAPDAVKVAAISLIDKLNIQDSAVAMEIVSNPKLSPRLRSTALQLLASHNDPKLQDAVKICLADKNPMVRTEAIRSLAKLPDASAQLQSLLANASVSEKQAAYFAIGQLSGHEADEILSKAMDELTAGKIPAPLQLDVLEAAARRSDSGVRGKVQSYNDSLSKTDPLAQYRVALEGGDAETGYKLFHNRVDLSCIRCHSARGEGGIVGPKLDGIGARQTRDYILESIVLPNAKIAPGYESAVVKTKPGKTLVGVVRRENADELVLLDNDGKEIHIPKADIISRERGLSAMPEGLVKLMSKRDLRDIVEFLASSKR